MVHSQHLWRWSALVLASAVSAALLAYVAGGLAAVLGQWRWAPSAALLSLPGFLALGLLPAARLAPQVTRAQRVWGWMIAILVAGICLTGMTFVNRGDDARLTREVRAINSTP